MFGTQCEANQLLLASSLAEEREFHSRNTRVCAHRSYWHLNYQTTQNFWFYWIFN